MHLNIPDEVCRMFRLLVEGTLENPVKSGAEGARATPESLRQKDRSYYLFSGVAIVAAFFIYKKEGSFYYDFWRKD